MESYHAAQVRSFRLHLAVRILRRHGLIVYPTDTVFGLGCHPGSALAVQQICRFKGRSLKKGLVLIASTYAQLTNYVTFNPDRWPNMIRDSWPNLITWVVPAAASVPDYITGGRGTVAVRLCSHPVVAQLCQSLASPLVSTSANISGHPPARNLHVARHYFKSSVDCYLNGAVDHSAQASEIRQFPSGQVLRSRTD